MFIALCFPPFIEGKLKKKKNQGGLHVTLAYKPNAEQEALFEIGKEVVVKIVGYGIDDENEGFLVEFEGIPYFGAAQKHITLSVSETGRPVNTAFLNMTPEKLQEYKKTTYVPEYVTGIITKI